MKFNLIVQKIKHFNLASSVILAEAVELAVSAFELLSAVADVTAGVLRLEGAHAFVLADLGITKHFSRDCSKRRD